MSRPHINFLRLVSSTAIIIVTFLGLACSKNEATAPNTTADTRPSPAPATSATQPPPPKDGSYKGKGLVTKIDLNASSVELDHENIQGLMPAMKMEFYVTDKAQLKGLAVGERVDFVIEYRGGRETISSIGKTK